MLKTDFTLKFIKNFNELHRLVEKLVLLPAFALDIETVDWWNQHRERIALIQIAFRTEGQIKVFIIDTLANFELSPLHLPLDQSSTIKIIHNAAFDAARLKKHFGFTVEPIFDTMAAARRSGESRYSLKAQAAIHLNLQLNKSAQGSDWSRRPLDSRQLHYAALDPYSTLLLYENQSERNLNGAYLLKSLRNSTQNLLPLDDLPLPIESSTSSIAQTVENISSETEIPVEAIALLGVITELPSRYSPDGLAASVGSERVGLAGWIIDQRLGVNAEPDEETVKLVISHLAERKLINITDTRRMEATEAGALLWRKAKK